MDMIGTLMMIVPVILIAAFILLIVRRISEKESLIDMRGAVVGVIILVTAVLVIAPMAMQSATYLYDEDTGTLTVQKDITGSSQPWTGIDQATVKSIIVKDGVSVSSGAFSGMTNVEYVSVGADAQVSTAFAVNFVDPFGEPLEEIEGDFAIYDGDAYLADPEIYRYSSDGTAVLGLKDGVTGVVAAIIPAKNGTKDITSIGARAFRDNTDIIFSTSIGAVTSIEINAFTSCTALEAARFPDATTISSYAFQVTSGMTWADLSSATTLGNYVFTDSTIESISLPKCTEIGTRCFQRCAALTSASLPKITALPQDAFSGCTLLSTIDMGAITEIGGGAFGNCAALEAAAFPYATTAGNYAFQGCTSLSHVSMPSITTVGTQCFNGDTAITTVTLGPLESVQSNSFNSWTFYESDGTTQIDKTVAANLAGHTFEGTASALVMVEPGQLSLTPEQIQLVHDLTVLHPISEIQLTDPEINLQGGETVGS